MGKYVCVYCDVDPAGHHIKGCPKYKELEEMTTRKFMDEFEELIGDIADKLDIKVPKK